MVVLDTVAYDDANKGLTICFIILITIVNCILIYKKIRIAQFLHTPRSLIMISLAIGDIFLALFALVVRARVLFESAIGCNTHKAYFSYLYFLVHFVYGLGLAVLAAEFVQRNRNPQPAGNNSSRIIKSVVYSACPWIIGLIIILPLTMADAYTEEYGECWLDVKNSRFNAMYVVSVILPAILAVLVCIAVMFINLSPPSPATVSYQVSTQDVVTNSHNTNIINATGPPQYPGSNEAAAQSCPITNTQGPQQYPNNAIPGTAMVPTAPANDETGPNNWGQNVSTPSDQHPVQQYTGQQYPGQQYPGQQYPGQQYPGQQYPGQQYPGQQYPGQHYPGQQYPGQQYPGQQYPVQQYPAQQYPIPQYAVQYSPPQYPVPQYAPQTNTVYIPPTNIAYQQNTTAPTVPVKERNALLIAAIVYVICVVPAASFTISELPSIELDYDAYTIINNVLFWLSIFRSLITPIIFNFVD